MAENIWENRYGSGGDAGIEVAEEEWQTHATRLAAAGFSEGGTKSSAAVAAAVRAEDAAAAASISALASTLTAGGSAAAAPAGDVSARTKRQTERVEASDPEAAAREADLWAEAEYRAEKEGEAATSSQRAAAARAAAHCAGAESGVGEAGAAEADKGGVETASETGKTARRAAKDLAVAAEGCSGGGKAFRLERIEETRMAGRAGDEYGGTYENATVAPEVGEAADRGNSSPEGEAAGGGKQAGAESRTARDLRVSKIFAAGEETTGDAAAATESGDAAAKELEAAIAAAVVSTHREPPGGGVERSTRLLKIVGREPEGREEPTTLEMVISGRGIAVPGTEADTVTKGECGVMPLLAKEAVAGFRGQFFAAATSERAVSAAGDKSEAAAAAAAGIEVVGTAAAARNTATVVGDAAEAIKAAGSLCRGKGAAVEVTSAPLRSGEGGDSGLAAGASLLETAAAAELSSFHGAATAGEGERVGRGGAATVRQKVLIARCGEAATAPTGTTAYDIGGAARAFAAAEGVGEIAPSFLQNPSQEISLPERRTSLNKSSAEGQLLRNSNCSSNSSSDTSGDVTNGSNISGPNSRDSAVLRGHQSEAGESGGSCRNNQSEFDHGTYSSNNSEDSRTGSCSASGSIVDTSSSHSTTSASSSGRAAQRDGNCTSVVNFVQNSNSSGGSSEGGSSGGLAAPDSVEVEARLSSSGSADGGGDSRSRSGGLGHGSSYAKDSMDSNGRVNRSRFSSRGGSLEALAGEKTEAAMSSNSDSSGDGRLHSAGASSNSNSSKAVHGACGEDGSNTAATAAEANQGEETGREAANKYTSSRTNARGGAGEDHGLESEEDGDEEEEEEEAKKQPWRAILGTEDLLTERDDEVLQLLTEKEPCIPDELCRFFLHRVGCATTDRTVARLISVAAQLQVERVMDDAKIFAFCMQQAATATSSTSASPSSFAAHGDRLRQQPVDGSAAAAIRKDSRTAQDKSPDDVTELDLGALCAALQKNDENFHGLNLDCFLDVAPVFLPAEAVPAPPAAAPTVEAGRTAAAAAVVSGRRTAYSAAATAPAATTGGESNTELSSRLKAPAQVTLHTVTGVRLPPAISSVSTDVQSSRDMSVCCDDSEAGAASLSVPSAQYNHTTKSITAAAEAAGDPRVATSASLDSPFQAPAVSRNSNAGNASAMAVVKNTSYLTAAAPITLAADLVAHATATFPSVSGDMSADAGGAAAASVDANNSSGIAIEPAAATTLGAAARSVAIDAAPFAGIARALNTEAAPTAADSMCSVDSRAGAVGSPAAQSFLTGFPTSTAFHAVGKEDPPMLPDVAGSRPSAGICAPAAAAAAEGEKAVPAVDVDMAAAPLAIPAEDPPAFDKPFLGSVVHRPAPPAASSHFGAVSQSPLNWASTLPPPAVVEGRNAAASPQVAASEAPAYLSLKSATSSAAAGATAEASALIAVSSRQIFTSSPSTTGDNPTGSALFDFAAVEKARVSTETAASACRITAPPALSPFACQTFFAESIPAAAAAVVQSAAAAVGTAAAAENAAAVAARRVPQRFTLDDNLKKL